MKYVFTILCSFFALLTSVHGDEGKKETATLPDFADYELEIFDVIGHTNHYVPPQFGDTTNMSKLNMDDVQEFLTFTSQSEEAVADQIALIHNLSKPTLVVHRERTSGLSHINEINEYMVRSLTHADRQTVEIHVREVVSDQGKNYHVHILQTFDGMFTSLVVLGSKEMKESYLWTQALHGGPPPDNATSNQVEDDNSE